jgi:hypothetical protein
MRHFVKFFIRKSKMKVKIQKGLKESMSNMRDITNVALIFQSEEIRYMLNGMFEHPDIFQKYVGGAGEKFSTEIANFSNEIHDILKDSKIDQNEYFNAIKPFISPNPEIGNLIKLLQSTPLLVNALQYHLIKISPFAEAFMKDSGIKPAVQKAIIAERVALNFLYMNLLRPSCTSKPEENVTIECGKKGSSFSEGSNKPSYIRPIQYTKNSGLLDERLPVTGGLIQQSQYTKRSSWITISSTKNGEFLEHAIKITESRKHFSKD